MGAEKNVFKIQTTLIVFGFVLIAATNEIVLQLQNSF